MKSKESCLFNDIISEPEKRWSRLRRRNFASLVDVPVDIGMEGNHLGSLANVQWSENDEIAGVRSLLDKHDMEGASRGYRCG